MDTDVRLRLAVASLWTTLGCAPSLQSDVARVHEASRTRAALPVLHEGRAHEDDRDVVRALLEKPLDDEAVVRVALLHNRELRARLRELGVAEARVLGAGLVKNPLFEVEILPERDSSLELRVEYEITSLLMAPMKRSAERHELDAARLDVAGEVIQLGYDVRRAFYSLQTAERRLALSQLALDSLAAGRDAALALVKAGNAPELDAASQVVSFERARITVAELELDAATAREALQRLLGLHGAQTSWTLDLNMAPLPVETPIVADLEREALQANLGLAAMRARLEAIARRTGIARTEGWLPDVSVDVHALRTDGENDDDRWRYGGGVSVEVPLFDHGQGERREHEARFDVLVERYQALAVALRSRARDASNRLRSTHARAAQYERVIVPAQTTVLEQTLLQYNAMQVGVFQLLEARRALLDVQLAHADTLRNYWNARAELDALLAGRMVEGDTTKAENLGASASEGGH